MSQDLRPVKPSGVLEKLFAGMPATTLEEVEGRMMQELQRKHDQMVVDHVRKLPVPSRYFNLRSAF